MKKVVKRFLLGLGVLLLAFFIWLPADNYTTHPIRFVSKRDTLSGVLNVPENLPKDSLTLLIFVHGDGALPANAHGYYEPIWRHLAAKGVVTLAWDKKGVGGSQGNWLQQDMQARAQEVRDALKHVKASQKWQFSTVGVIGFSQGAWVLPLLHAQSKTQFDFMVIVSGAVNWMQQSNYLTTQRLKQQGRNAQEIAKCVAQNKADHQFLLQKKSYEAYLEYERKKQTIVSVKPHLMTKDRYYFVQKNIVADATKGLQRLKCPVLALFGDKDLNVNFQESASVYWKVFKKHHSQSSVVKTYANATHGLLKYEHFQKIRPDATFMFKFWLWGQNAFAPRVLDDIRAFALYQKLL